MALLRDGKARATKIENARFQIKGLLKDYADADKRLSDIMSDVNYGVESTAYGLDAAATVAAQLVASGKEAGDGMRAALRGISGVAAMTNSSYEEIGQIYTTVAGNGRLMSEQLLQLSSRGMNAAATLAKALGKSEAEVRDMVSKGKIDFDTFAKAMDNAFGEHAKDANKTFNGVISNIKAALAKIGADFYSPLIAENSPMVKFLNSIRNRINEIRNTLGPITSDITTRINNFITTLNKAFTDRNLFGFNPLANMIDKVKEIKNTFDNATAPIKNAANALNSAGKALKDYGTLVDEIIAGKWGNAPTRFQDLAAAGYDWAHAQNLVNEKLGNSFRYADNYTESVQQATTTVENLSENINDLTDEQLRNMGFTEEQVSAFSELRKMAEKTGIPIKELIELISKTTEVEENGEKKQVSAFSTRYLILNSLKNIGLTLVSVLKSIGKGFAEAFSFDANGVFNLIAAFHKLTVIIRDKVERNADQLSRTFRGLFSVIHLLATILGGGLRIALTIINKVLGAFNISFLDVTAAVGDLLYSIDQWITSNYTIIQVGKAVVEIIVAIVKCIFSVITSLKNLAMQNKAVVAFVNGMATAFHNLGQSIETWTKGLKETDNVPKYIIQGLVNGLKSGAEKVYKVISSVATGLIETFKKVLGIHSPSTVFIALGGFLIAGLIAGIQGGSFNLYDVIKGIGNTIINIFKNMNIGNALMVAGSAALVLLTAKLGLFGDAIPAMIEGLKNTFQLRFSKLFFGLGVLLIGSLIAGMKDQSISLYDVLKGIGNKIIELFQNLNIGNVIAVGVSAGILLTTNKLLNIVKDVSEGIAGLGDMFRGLGSALYGLGEMATDFGKAAKIKAFSDILKSITVAIIGLVAAIAILGSLDPKQLKQGSIALSTLAGGLIIFLGVITLMSKQLSTLKLPNIGTILAMLLGISGAILIISMALNKIAKIDPERMEPAIWGLFACVAALAILVLEIALVSELLKGTKNISKMGTVFLKVAASLLIVATVLKKMDGLSEEAINKMKRVVTGLGELLLAIAVLNKFTKGSLDKSAETIKSVGIALLLLVVSMKIAGKLKPQAFKNGEKTVKLFLLLILGMMAISNMFKETEMMKVTSSILFVSGALLMMALSCKILSGIEPEQMKKGISAVSLLIILLTALVAITQISSKEKMGNCLLTLAGVSALLIAMAAVTWLMGQMDGQKLLKGLGAVTALTVLIDSILVCANRMTAGKQALKMMITITVMIGLLVAALVGLSFLDPTKLLTSTMALSGVMLSLAAVIASVKNIKELPKGATKTLLSMVLVIGAIGAIIALLSNIADPKGVIPLTLSLVGLMGAMILFLEPLYEIGKTIVRGQKSMNAGLKALTSMVVPLIAFVAVLALMSNIKSDEIIPNVLGLSLLMATMILLIEPLYEIGKLTKGKKSMATAIVALTAMVIPLAAFAAVLWAMGKVDKAEENALALATLATTMTVVVAALTALGAIVIGTAGIGAGAIAIGIAALAAMALPLLAFVGVLQAMSGIQNATENCKALTSMVKALTESLVLIGLVAPLLVVADVALMGLIAIIGVFGTFAVAVGALMDKFPSLENFLNKGIDTLIKIAEGLGKVVGVFVTALADSVMDLIPKIGNKLSEFMENASPFFEGMKGIDGSLRDNVKIITKAITDLVKATVGNAASKKFLDGDMGEFGSKLGEFAYNALPLFATCMTIKPESAKGIKLLAEAIKAMVDAELSENLNNLLKHVFKFEGDDLASFGKKLGGVGEGLKAFAENTTDVDATTVKKAEQSSKAIQALVEAAQVIDDALNVNSVGDFLGEVAQKMVGGKETLSSFTGAMGDIANNIKSYIINLPRFTEGNLNAVQKSTEIIKKLVEVCSGIGPDIVKSTLLSVDNNGVDIGKVEIEQTDFGRFVDYIPKFATKLSEMVNAVGGFDDSKLEKVKTVSDILATLSEFVKGTVYNIKNWSKDMQQDFSTGNYMISPLTALGQDLSNLATTLETFATTIDGLDNVGSNFGPQTPGSGLERIKNKLTSLSELMSVINGMKIEGLTNLTQICTTFKDSINDEFKNAIERLANKDLDIETFKTNFTTILAAYKEIADEFKGYDEQNLKSISGVNELIQTISGIDFSGADGSDGIVENTKLYGEALVGFGEKLKEFKTKMDDLSIEDIKNLVTKFATFKEGLSTITVENVDNLNNFSNALADLGSKAISAFTDAISGENAIKSVAECAQNAVNKFVSEIQQSKDTPITDTIKNTFVDAFNNSNDELVNKATDVGKNVVIGFVNGMSGQQQSAYSKAYAVGQSAINGLHDGTDSNSPSKAACLVGNFVGQGFLIGMSQFYDKAFNSSYEMGDNAVAGLQNAINTVAAIVNDGIDDDLTIRPVLDLSNVKEGTNELRTMLNTNSVGVATNLNAISYGMKNYRQNGGENVVDAIDRLGKDLNNSNSNTYNINGITYENGTEVSEAVQTLIRAIKIERRS